MMDLPRLDLPAAAQNQVMILAALEPFSETTNFPCKRCPDHGEVTNVVLRQEKIGIPFRLEVGLKAATSLIDLVLVGVNQLQTGLRDDGLGYLQQIGSASCRERVCQYV